MNRDDAYDHEQLVAFLEEQIRLCREFLQEARTPEQKADTERLLREFVDRLERLNGAHEL